MRPTKFKLITDPIFRSEILFYISKNGDDVICHAERKCKSKLNIGKFDGFKGICSEIYDDKTKITFWIVWVNDKKDWKTMSHEALHLVFRILDKRGVKYSSDNDETFCYLHEYFISKFWHIMCQ